MQETERKGYVGKPYGNASQCWQGSSKVKKLSMQLLVYHCALSTLLDAFGYSKSKLHSLVCVAHMIAFCQWCMLAEQI